MDETINEGNLKANLYSKAMDEMEIDNISVESWRTPSEASFHSDDFSITDQYLVNAKEDTDLPEFDDAFFLEDFNNDDILEDTEERTLPVESHIFVKDSTYAWLPAKVISTNSTHAVVSISKPKVNLEDPKEFFKPFSQIDKEQSVIDLQEYSSSNVIPFQNLKVGVEYNELTPMQCMASNSDLKDMVHINEASVLYNFKIRHDLKMPYVRVGKLMMVAMNPFAYYEEELYSWEIQRAYANRYIWSVLDGVDTVVPLPAHIYELTSFAIYNLLSSLKPEPQTILLLGESGSGKTETSKILISHLLNIQKPKVSENMEKKRALMQNITASHHVLEAFGHAKTGLNDNSSRFVKHEKIYYHIDEVTKVITVDGCISDIKMFIKNRSLGHREKGSRSFHIFYQLLEAPDEVKNSVWKKFVEGEMTSEDCAYLGKHRSRTINDKTDAEHWQTTVKSLEILGIKDKALEDLLKAVFIVMFLGNVKFVPSIDKNERKCVVSTEGEISLIAELLEIDSAELKNALISRTSFVHGELHTMPISTDEAIKNRDSLAKEIYHGLFLQLVEAINKATAPSNPNSSATVGIFDIFGFECFKNTKNEFEQLLINYLNEKLHYQYLQNVFISTKEEYDREGIDLIKYDISDNIHILDFYEKPTGLFPLLAAESALPNQNSTSFISKLKTLHQNNTGANAFVNNDDAMKDTEFAIKHFAGEVKYEASDFPSKDTDALAPSLAEVVSKSPNAMIKNGLEMIMIEKNRMEKSNVNQPTSSISSKMSTQLSSMIVDIKRSNKWWIQCIKPNNFKRARYMDNKVVIRQMRSAGIIGAAKIAKDTFSESLDLDELFSKFGTFLDNELDTAFGDITNSFERLDNKLANALKDMKSEDTESEYAIGNGKVYFSQNAIEHLYKKHAQWYFSCVLVAQRILRKATSRRLLKKEEASATKIQAMTRGILVRKQVKKINSAIRLIQSFVRFRYQLSKNRKVRRDKAVRLIQARWRIIKLKNYFRETRSAAITIQRKVRKIKQRNKGSMLLNLAMDHLRMRKKIKYIHEKLTGRIQNDMGKFELDMGDAIDMRNLLDRLLHQLNESQARNVDLIQRLDDIMIINDSVKAKTVSIDAHSYVQLQLQKELESKRKAAEEIEALREENAALKDALQTSRQTNQSITDEKLHLIGKVKQLNQLNEQEKEINRKNVQNIEQKLKEAQEAERNRSNNSKNIVTNSLALENAASRFNKVNQSLKETKWNLQIEKGKVSKLENEVRELKAEILEDHGGDSQKTRYKEEIKRLNNEIARLRKELTDLHSEHKLELKQSFDKIIVMQTEWKRKEDELQSNIDKTKIECQREVAKLRYDLEEAQSINGGKLLAHLKEEKKKWESTSKSYKGRIAVLVDALDEQVGRCKDLEDELELTKETLRKSTGLRHIDMKNLTKDMRRKNEAGRLQFQKKLRKMKSIQKNISTQDDTGEMPAKVQN